MWEHACGTAWDCVGIIVCAYQCAAGVPFGENASGMRWEVPVVGSVLVGHRWEYACRALPPWECVWDCFGSVPVGTMLGRVAGPAFYCRKVAECAYGTALGACRRDWVGTGLGLGCL